MAFPDKIARTHNKRTQEFKLYRKFNLYETQNLKTACSAYSQETISNVMLQ